MKASELRIGNWIHFNNLLGMDHDYQVTPRTFSGSMMNEDFEFNNYHKPIPLTDDWLVKFGFAKYGNDFVMYLSDYSDLTYSNGVMYLRCGQFAEMTEAVPCEYVHQLQNIIYVLTGKELTLI